MALPPSPHYNGAMMENVDPKLTKAIKDVRSGALHGTVRATIALKSLDPSKPVLSPDQTNREVGRIVRAVEKKTGKTPRELDVFDQIQSFSINADAEMVDHILNEDAVTAAQFGGTSD